ncbi:MAG TPA: hypothetical protein DDZ90_22510 [Planctomycetaceae bacterium]|nr:hypothetical protein [Planctomycetaceae bacterium]
MNDLKASRILLELNGGYRDDESEWQQTIEKMVDAMIRLEKAMSPFVAELKAIG